MTEKIYLESLRSVLGRSIFHYLEQVWIHVNFAKFFRNTFLENNSRWLHLDMDGMRTLVPQMKHFYHRKNKHIWTFN